MRIDLYEREKAMKLARLRALAEADKREARRAWTGFWLVVALLLVGVALGALWCALARWP